MFIQQFRSENSESQYYGIVGIRRILSIPNDPPVQEVIDNGLVIDFIKYLDHIWPEFQFEALWCLTNIACGTTEHCVSLVNKGAIPKIVAIVDSPIQEVEEQAIWALGNIAGDSTKVRDKVIQCKGLEKILKHFSTADRPSLVKHCTWSLSNFCRSKPAPDYEIMKQVRILNL
jgi:importin subunit alpha-1